MNRPLLAWYEPRRKRYPWRRSRDPYRILVSEVMLQQTQAARVVPAFEAFVARFPDAGALAAATRADVLRAWGSLGYNRRAVALHGAATVIVAAHGGEVPSEFGELLALPGIGPYTAAAVASIAFGAAVPAIDTNVARVVARVKLGADSVSPADVRSAAVASVDRRDPGAWNQAVMDLGREICRPIPRCSRCPMARACRFRATGAVPERGGRSQPPFRGSFREVRGGVVRALRGRSPLTLASLSRTLSQPLPRVSDAVNALGDDGLVVPGPAARAGRPAGVVRLPT